MKVLSSPVPGGGRRVVFISSDREDASAEVARLAGKLGFAPIEVGKVAEGGRLIQARMSGLAKLIHWLKEEAERRCRHAAQHQIYCPIAVDGSAGR
jgi:predicted dinucleotide-binding enzyme